MTPLDNATARGRASVAGAIDPRLRSAPPYVPPPRRRKMPVLEWTVVEPPVVEPPVVEAPEDSTAGQDRLAALHRPSERSPAPNPDVEPKPSRPRNRGKRVILPIAAALLAAFVGGTGYLMIQDAPVTDDVGRWTGTPQVTPSAADAAPFAVSVEGDGADPFGTNGPMPTGVPTRLKVDAIHLDTPLETLRIGGNGALTPPKDFAKAGWYADGTRPGDTGPAVIAGHVDSKRGPAVFYDLRKVTKGDRIEVVRGGRTVRFTVTATAWYPKHDFPTDEVYGPTPDRQLRLITCGGVFDHSLRSYKDNLVVYAVAG